MQDIQHHTQPLVPLQVEELLTKVKALHNL
jgi:hypothetical protein